MVAGVAVLALCFGLPRDAFVATSTAVGVMIDLARVPVYVALRGHALEPAMPLLLGATGGVVVLVIAILLLVRPPSRGS